MAILLGVLLLGIAFRLGQHTNPVVTDLEQGRKLAEHGHYKESIIVLNRWIGNHPGDLWSWGYLALDHERLGDYFAAVKDYSFMLKFGDDPEVLNKRACAYLTLKDYQHAIDDCNTALTKLSTHTKSLVTRGRADCAEGKYEDATVDFTKAIDVDPKLASAYHYRAIAYEKLGKANEAKADDEKSKSLGYVEMQ
jgi:tetratricopeptide (TPR) repeat protein